jgi:phosphohistidine phosphatase
MTERILVLLRHAKAEPQSGTADADRPLTSRGHADAGAAGAWLAGHGYRPELVICSPAKRTRQTWHAVALSLAEPAQSRPGAGPGSASGGDPAAGSSDGSGTGAAARPTVRYERAVYDSGVRALVDLIRGVDETVGTVLLIGHNPTISQLSALLDPDGGVDSDGLRTSGIAVHRLTGSWAKCGPQLAPLAAAHTARG